MSDVASSSSGEARKFRVLLADYDGLMMNIHKNLLVNKFNNLEVETVINGMEAVCAFREGLKFDLLFLEQKVGVLDGITVAKTLHQMEVKCKIVGLYGTATAAERDAFGKAPGVHVLLQKPLTEQTVKEILDWLEWAQPQ